MDNIIDYCVCSVSYYVILCQANKNLDKNIDIHIPKLNNIVLDIGYNILFNSVIKKLETNFTNIKFNLSTDYIDGKNILSDFVYFEWTDR